MFHKVKKADTKIVPKTTYPAIRNININQITTLLMYRYYAQKKKKNLSIILAIEEVNNIE